MQEYWATGDRLDALNRCAAHARVRQHRVEDRRISEVERLDGTSEPREVRVTAVDMHSLVLVADAPVHSRILVAVGLKLVLGLVLVGLSVGASALMVYTVRASLFSGSQETIRGEYAAITALKLQHRVVEQRRSAVAASAANVADFRTSVARRPAAPGVDVLGLDAAEARRRENVLISLTLECIHAVDQYNLGAQAIASMELQLAGLPERFVWAVDCTSAR